MTVLNAGRFAGSGVGHAPKRPAVAACGRAPKRPTGFAARYPTISPTQRQSELSALFNRLFL